MDGAIAAFTDPGPLHVRLTAPAGARDIGAMLVIEGPAIDSVQAPGLEIFETDESSSTRREVVIAGALAPDAPVLRVWVPHRGDEARYRIRLLQVAGEGLIAQGPGRLRKPRSPAEAPGVAPTFEVWGRARSMRQDQDPG